MNIVMLLLMNMKFWIVNDSGRLFIHDLIGGELIKVSDNQKTVNVIYRRVNPTVTYTSIGYCSTAPDVACGCWGCRLVLPQRGTTCSVT